MVGVVHARQDTVCNLSFHAIGARSHYICNRNTFALPVIAALQLMGCNRTTPEEVFRNDLIFHGFTSFFIVYTFC